MFNYHTLTLFVQCRMVKSHTQRMLSVSEFVGFALTKDVPSCS